MPSTRGELEVASWDEETYFESEVGTKLTRATVTQNVTGDITGTARADWLMHYLADGTARYVGLQRIEGEIGGQRGSFVVETTGEFDGAVAQGPLRVVDGSGTGAFEGIHGDGKFQSPKGTKARFELDYIL